MLKRYKKKEKSIKNKNEVSNNPRITYIIIIRSSQVSNKFVKTTLSNQWRSNLIDKINNSVIVRKIQT